MVVSYSGRIGSPTGATARVGKNPDPKHPGGWNAATDQLQKKDEQQLTDVRSSFLENQ